MAHGGKRQGAGRPPGKKNVLPQGTVAAIRAAKLRVPEEASEEERELAGHALTRIIDVMDERVSSFNAHGVLTAARHLREEICGPIPKKHELTGKDGAPLVVEVIRYADVAGPGETPE